MIVTTQERTAWFQSARNSVVTAAGNTFLDTLQPWIERVCWNVLGYTLEQATYTEFLPYAGSERPPLSYGIDIGFDLIGGVVMPRSRTDLYEGAVQLTNLPARSVSSVYENLAAWYTGAANGDWPAGTLLPATAYRLDQSEAGLCKSGRLYRTVGSWSSSPRTVKVTYTAGYTQAEIDAKFGGIKMAVLMGLGWWWGKAMQSSAAVKTNGLMASELSIRDFSVTLTAAGQLNQVPGVWAGNVLGPESLNLLIQYVNMTRFVGT